MLPLLRQLNALVATPEPPCDFKLGTTYRTRGVFHRCDGIAHQSATVIGTERDHCGKLLLRVRYSDGRTDWLTAKGRTGLGHPHACDLTHDELMRS